MSFRLPTMHDQGHPHHSLSCSSRSRSSTALGIVYGDIGTSPLYVFQAIAKTNGGHFDEASALGSLSLIFWTLIISFR